MDRTPKEHWAEEKVRKFSPPTREKSTLLAIAHYADPDGSHSFAKIETLARDTGQSTRTIKRHLKILEERGELIVRRSLARERRSNDYVVVCCSMSFEQLYEIKTGMRYQLKLPLVSLDISREQVINALGVLSPSECHDDTSEVTPCHPTNQRQFKIPRGEGFFILKLKKETPKVILQAEPIEAAAVIETDEELHEIMRDADPEFFARYKRYKELTEFDEQHSGTRIRNLPPIPDLVDMRSAAERTMEALRAGAFREGELNQDA